MNRRSFVTRAAATTWGLPFIIKSSALGLDGAVAPSNRVTLGVIGVGAQGTVDLRAFLNHDDVRVTALCDVNTQNLDRAKALIKERYGSADVKTYGDFRELNRDAGVDAVLMALPVHWHSIPAADAILNGKHIYHEKPMGMSFEEARFVREAVRKTGVVFQFGMQQRSDMKFRWASELARNGRLGKLEAIQVGVPGGKTSPIFVGEPVPSYLDWERWVGPAPMTLYSPDKLKRDNHENISNFSLGMISCWGIHHLDIAQWGNGTDATGPVSVEGSAEYPQSGTCDLMTTWRIRYEFAQAAPVTFVNEGRDGITHGTRFIGDSGWVHVLRGGIKASDEAILRDPQNKVGTMPVKLPVSLEHTRNFVDAIKNRTRAICDIESSVRSDMLPQLAAITLKAKRKLAWNPETETFGDDAAANALLAKRPFRGEWKF
ncbi:MAG: Gfo/Idh/MocA family oxidoreductase [Prosthecobacter sp.]|nr:Gfo/Idh/MocA family oxidoreductase [Prosthecobacter sp.]